MRFKTKAYFSVQRVFSVLPHATEEGYIVWLEKVWRKLECTHGGCFYIYHINRPEDWK